MKNVVILISGRGSNMQAIVHAQLQGKLPCRIAAVISNVADAGGLAFAAEHGIPTAILSHRDFHSREGFDAALATLIDGYSPDLVVLAGFMRILSGAFTAHYAGRLLNIHPSLLPAFKGLHTHQQALTAGVKIHGCTVHFVTPELDHGPIIAQAAVPVSHDDTPDSLAARVLVEEHRLYPEAVRRFVTGSLTLTPHGTVVVRD